MSALPQKAEENSGHSRQRLKLLRVDGAPRQSCRTSAGACTGQAFFGLLTIDANKRDYYRCRRTTAIRQPLGNCQAIDVLHHELAALLD